jgi:hypothetical protein
LQRLSAAASQNRFDLVPNYGTDQWNQRLQLVGARISKRYALDVLSRQNDFDWQPQTNAAMQGQSCILNPCIM